MPRALDAWQKIDLVDGREANQFRAVVWRVAPPQVTGEVTGEVVRLLAVMQGEMKRTDMQAAQGLVEMTSPDKPKIRLQRYRLTAAGHAGQRAWQPRE